MLHFVLNAKVKGSVRVCKLRLLPAEDKEEVKCNKFIVIIKNYPGESVFDCEARV
jgi:hypothetical protein